MRKYINHIWPLLVMGTIYYFSSLSGPVINSVGLASETYHINGHFFMYFILYIAWYKATKLPLQSFTFTTLYAFFDEYHQSFVVGRSSSFFDIVVDISGAILAALFLWKLSFILPKTLRNWLLK